ncbi:MAG: hypothetical protein OH318_01760 [Candidatus Parvarchaeota archaeon]|nr:hypothetical protein [Candidatus Rehaiarchaeum fermentans]
MSLEKILSECKNREDKLKTILGLKYYNISIFDPLSKFLNGNKICDIIDLSLNLLNSTPIEKNKLIEIISLYDIDKALKILQNLFLIYLLNNANPLDKFNSDYSELFSDEKFTYLVDLYTKEETLKVINNLQEKDFLLLINSFSKLNLIEKKDVYFLLNYLNSNNFTPLLNFVNNLSGNQRIKADFLANLLNINISVKDISNFNKFIEALNSEPNYEKRPNIYFLVQTLYKYLFSYPGLNKNIKSVLLSKTSDALYKYHITKLFDIYNGFLSDDLEGRSNYREILFDVNKLYFFWNVLLSSEFSNEISKYSDNALFKIVSNLKYLTISIEEKSYFSDIERLIKIYPHEINKLLEYLTSIIEYNKALVYPTIKLAKKGFLEYLKLLVTNQSLELNKFKQLFNLFEKAEYVDLLLTSVNIDKNSLSMLENLDEYSKYLNKFVFERYNINKELNPYQLYLLLSLNDSKRKRVISLINKSTEKERNYYNVLLGDYNFNITSSITRNPLECDGRKFNSDFCLPAEDNKEKRIQFSLLNIFASKNNIIDFLQNENSYIISYRIDGIPIGAVFLTVKDEFRVKLIEGNPFFHQRPIFEVVYNDILKRANENGFNAIFDTENESETYRDFLNYLNFLKNKI